MSLSELQPKHPIVRAYYYTLRTLTYLGCVVVVHVKGMDPRPDRNVSDCIHICNRKPVILLLVTHWIDVLLIFNTLQVITLTVGRTEQVTERHKLTAHDPVLAMRELVL